jgi:ActR/RegA family two-component response regulator
MDAKRILFVDDEPGIRQTLARVLQMFGYESLAVGSVAEALGAITSQSFDVLIADLNIGQPGDGFTVVSAMRRTQPQCITLILTGYPALDTALQAIRSQVDDYIIKPASIPSLLGTIEQKLQHQGTRHPLVVKRISQLLCERRDEIVERTLHAMSSESERNPVFHSDQQGSRHLSEVLDRLCRVLETGAYGGVCIDGLLGEGGREHADRLPSLAVNLRLLQSAVYEVIHENLLSLHLSSLLPDLLLLNAALARQLQHTLCEFADAEHRAA